MEEQLITKNTALLLKNKKFLQKIKEGVVCRIQNSINKDYEIIRKISIDDLNNSWAVFNEVYLSQSLVQKFLRENHNIHIEVKFNNYTNEYFGHVKNEKSKIKIDLNLHKSYEETLEEGLIKGLNLI